MNKKIIITLSCILMLLGVISIPNSVNAAQYYQEVKTGISAFPADYQAKLNALASAHPNWEFQAYNTGISWNDLISKERGNDGIHKNRVYYTNPSSWKHSCNFTENNYSCASDEIVAYYLDPRNFLNEKNIFQFVETSYNSKTQTVDAIKKSVMGTFLDKKVVTRDLNNNTVVMTYSQIIVDAAKKSNVSAFYLKSKIIQEVGVYGSNSVWGTYPGYEGLYNFFNYGATDSGDPIANGLRFAREQGWDSEYKSIVKGAQLIGEKYINAGQNTAYFNKWDVVGTKILKSGQSQTVDESDMFNHQYMTNIQDPTSQSINTYNLYKDVIDSNGKITFVIPVYNNMPSSNPMPQDISLKSIKMNTSYMMLEVGKTGWVGVTYNPTNATDKVLYWSSSNNDVATVSEGVIKAKKVGTAVLTATSRDGSKKATCTVDVKTKVINLKGISLKTTSLQMNKGESKTIYAVYNPTDASDKVLYWKSNNTDVATVSEGVVTAKNNGIATVTATSRDGNKTATCVIKVGTGVVQLQGISLKTTSLKMKPGEKSTIYAAYNPSNATDKVLYWSSSNTSVATVSEGVVTAKGNGTATITATSRDGNKKATCKVEVTVPLQSISLKTTSLKMKPGEKSTIYAVYNPSNVTDKVLYWSSSNTNVATVTDGVVTAKGYGTTTITAKSRDGGKTATCKVEVNDGKVALQSISLKTTSLNMKKGEQKVIYAVYNPSDATDKVLYWSSSNTNVATATDGVVTAKGNGTATITAKSRDGGKTATCKVTVGDGKTALQSISLKTTSIKMKKGDSTTIYAVYNPSDAYDKVLYWSSSNTSVATVSEGFVKAVGNGTATITAKSRDGGKTATCKVEVSDGKVALQSISLKTETIAMNKGENTTIYAVYNPTGATDKVLYWSSSDESVATVSEGVVTAKKNGTVTITAKSRDGGKTATCKVTVGKVALKSISLKTTSLTMKKGENKVIYAVYNPDNATDKVLYWSSNNESVVKVSEGLVKAVGKGTATVTAKSRDGGKTATCKITVSE